MKGQSRNHWTARVFPTPILEVEMGKVFHFAEVPRWNDCALHPSYHTVRQGSLRVNQASPEVPSEMKTQSLLVGRFQALGVPWIANTYGNYHLLCKCVLCTSPFPAQYVNY